MSCGLPIIASDLPVHHEICEKSAVYFPRFSEEVLCDQIMQVTSSPELRRELGSTGRIRAADFSWSRHVDQIVALASQLTPRRRNVEAGCNV